MVSQIVDNGRAVLPGLFGDQLSRGVIGFTEATRARSLPRSVPPPSFEFHRPDQTGRREETSFASRSPSNARRSTGSIDPFDDSGPVADGPFDSESPPPRLSDRRNPKMRHVHPVSLTTTVSSRSLTRRRRLIKTSRSDDRVSVSSSGTRDLCQARRPILRQHRIVSGSLDVFPRKG